MNFSIDFSNPKIRPPLRKPPLFQIFALKIVSLVKVDFCELRNLKDYQFDIIQTSWVELGKNGQIIYDSCL